MDRSLKQSLRLTAALALAVIGVSILLGRFSWGAGFLSGNLWAAANFLFTVGLFKIAASEKNKAKLAAILLVKFPLLYLIGFLLLTSGFFPLSSLLAGLVPFLAITAIIKNVRSASHSNAS